VAGGQSGASLCHLYQTHPYQTRADHGLVYQTRRDLSYLCLYLFLKSQILKRLILTLYPLHARLARDHRAY
jgi:hypothetical protein